MLSTRRVLFIYFVFISLASNAQLDGKWYTSFVIMGNSISFEMDVENENSESTIFLTDPEGKFTRQKMSSSSVTDSSLSFRWKDIDLSYEGSYVPESNTISGKMTQRDVKWEVVFYREAPEKIKLNRPQEPDLTASDLPFTAEKIVVTNGDVELHGELTLPLNFTKKTRIVVLVSGSGPQNRDSELMGHKPFLVIANYLAQEGIACLRFDDRGMGESTGAYAKATLNDFASDAEAWVNYLSERFSKNPVGIAGHSEGGVHALIVASRNEKVDFVVELASVGTSGRQVLIEQQYLIPEKEGEPESTCLWNQSVFAGMCDIIDSLDQKAAGKALTDFLGEKYDEAPEKYKQETNKFSFIMGNANFMNSQWGREFVRFQASDYLPKITVPILALNGSEDIQVPPVSNQAGFKTHLSKKSQKQSKIEIIEGVNHLFQTCKTCMVTEYDDLEETFSPVALKEIADWINGLKCL